MTGLTSNSERHRMRHVLLVEDSPGDVLLTKEAFLDGSHVPELHVVENGADALDFLMKKGKFTDAPRPDLILLDLNLPRVDGRQVLAEIKGDRALAMIPVIVLSTSQSQTDIASCYALHVNCFISKPVDFDHFSEIVHLIKNFWLQAVSLPDKG
jgi:two-component system, chemotaxis family, response regulator Rcp1